MENLNLYTYNSRTNFSLKFRPYSWKLDRQHYVGSTPATHSQHVQKWIISAAHPIWSPLTSSPAFLVSVNYIITYLFIVARHIIILDYFWLLCAHLITKSIDCIFWTFIFFPHYHWDSSDLLHCKQRLLQKLLIEVSSSTFALQSLLVATRVLIWSNTWVYPVSPKPSVVPHHLELCCPVVEPWALEGYWALNSGIWCVSIRYITF
jgi:hypothetical protein